MISSKYYLKSNVQIEPLVNLSHAYPFVIAPAANSMILSNYQLKTMQSYLQMPMAHVAALKDPDMIGGPFIDYNGGRLDEIKALKNSLENKNAHMIEFARGVKTLNEILSKKAKGHPLEDLYNEVPEIICGYIELVYDLQNQPNFRFIENLLYNSEFYDTSDQSIALTLIESDERPFIFSTPRLENENMVHLPIPFDNEKINQLCALKEEPQSYDYIKDFLGIPDEKDDTFMTFLQTEKHLVTNPFKEKGVRVRYFGHACALLETDKVTIMIDPLISYKYNSDIERFTFDDLPDIIDYVVITHCHHDHIVLETLLQLRSKIRHIIVPKAGGGYQHDPSMKLVLKYTGFCNIIEIDELEKIPIPGGEIIGLPFYGEHCDLNIRSKSTYMIKIENRSVLMVADSSCINPKAYVNTSKIVGDADLLFVGMECTGAPMSWSYGAFFTNPLDRQLDQIRRSKGSNCDTALELINIFNPSAVYLYAMGSEPWLNYFMALQHGHSTATDEECNRLISICHENGIACERLFAKKEIHLQQTEGDTHEIQSTLEDNLP